MKHLPSAISHEVSRLDCLQKDGDRCPFLFHWLQCLSNSDASAFVSLSCPRISSVLLASPHQWSWPGKHGLGPRLLQPTLCGATGRRGWTSSEPCVQPVLGLIPRQSQPLRKHHRNTFLQHPTHTVRGGHRLGAESGQRSRRTGWGPESHLHKLQGPLAGKAGAPGDQPPVEQQQRCLQQEGERWKTSHHFLACRHKRHGAQPEADLRGPCCHGDHWDRTHVRQGPAQHCGGEWMSGLCWLYSNWIFLVPFSAKFTVSHWLIL